MRQKEKLIRIAIEDLLSLMGPIGPQELSDAFEALADVRQVADEIAQGLGWQGKPAEPRGPRAWGVLDEAAYIRLAAWQVAALMGSQMHNLTAHLSAIEDPDLSLAQTIARGLDSIAERQKANAARIVESSPKELDEVMGLLRALHKAYHESKGSLRGYDVIPQVRALLAYYEGLIEA